MKKTKATRVRRPAWNSRARIMEKTATAAGQAVIKSRDQAEWRPASRWSYTRTQTAVPPHTMAFELDLSG
jgi:hypothetical protein